MIAAIILGSLYRPPEQRTSKNGKPFVSATLRIKDDDESRFVRVVAFSETVQNEIMRLSTGDALSVQGPLSASIYTAADGNSKVSLIIIANNLLALRQPPKERTAKTPEPVPQDTRPRQQRRGSWQSPTDGPNDDIGFGGSL